MTKTNAEKTDKERARRLKTFAFKRQAGRDELTDKRDDGTRECRLIDVDIVSLVKNILR